MTAAKTTARPSAKVRPAKAAPRSSGRPTKEQAGRITDHIIDVAMQLFLSPPASRRSADPDRGHGTDLPQADLLMLRFASKEALFAAVMRKGTNNLLVPLTESNRDDPIEATLVRPRRASNTRSRSGHRAERLISSEAHQFLEGG